MDVRVSSPDRPTERAVTVIVIRSIDLDSDAFASLVRAIGGESFLFFSDGAIGTGKTTTVEYLASRIENLLPYPQPIEKVRELTTPYYTANASFEKTSAAIQSLCRDHWLLPLEERAATGRPLPSMAVEHIPPPFHSWIFEKPFSATFDGEVARQRERLRRSREAVVEEYATSNHIVDALNTYPILRRFRSIIIGIVDPSFAQHTAQLGARGREEESVLSIGYLQYLRSKFQRAIWELVDRPQLPPIELRRYIDDRIEGLVLRFP